MRINKYHQLVRKAAIDFNEIDYYNDLENNIEFNYWFQIIESNFEIIVEDNWFSGRVILINRENGHRIRLIDREPIKIIKKRLKCNIDLFIKK